MSRGVIRETFTILCESQPYQLTRKRKEKDIATAAAADTATLMLVRDVDLEKVKGVGLEDTWCLISIG